MMGVYGTITFEVTVTFAARNLSREILEILRLANPPCPPSLRERGNMRNLVLRAQSAPNTQFSATLSPAHCELANAFIHQLLSRYGMRIGMMTDVYRPHVTGFTNYMYLYRPHFAHQGRALCTC